MIQMPRQLAQRIRAWNEELPRHPFPVGTAWGACWEYAWFLGTATVPASCKGARIVFFSGLGGETFQLLIESYAGHGAHRAPRPCAAGAQGHPAVPEAQCRVAKSTPTSPEERASSAS